MIFFIVERFLIIERESLTISKIVQLAEALTFTPTVHLNWNPSISKLKKEEVAAIFINIELKNIRIDEITKQFNISTGQSSSKKIPLFYLYTYENSENFKKAMQYHYTEKLQKPFKLENLYFLIEKYLELDFVRTENFEGKNKLRKLKDFSEEMKIWMQHLNQLIRQ